MSSLSRILKLARNTDGPVVIFDSYDNMEYVLERGKSEEDTWLEEMKAMNETENYVCGCDCECRSDEDDIDDALYSKEDDYLDRWYDFERRSLIEDMSSEDLISQINRDIAVWHAKEQQETQFKQTQQLEAELAPIQTPTASPFDFTWYTPSDVWAEQGLEERYLEPEAFEGMRHFDLPSTPLDWTDVSVPNTVTPYEVETPVSDAAMTYDKVDPNLEAEVGQDAASPAPIQIEPVPFDAPMVPMTEAEPLLETAAPVFYDEPIV
jgi:hypothetical protein